MRYRSPQMSSLSSDTGRVRTIHDAARIFAHRLGAKVFGRNGRCLELKRLRSVPGEAVYLALIGTKTGPRQKVVLSVYASPSPR
jgi:hypothetical protein